MKAQPPHNAPHPRPLDDAPLPRPLDGVVVTFLRHDEKITSTELYELIQIFVNGYLAK